MLPLKFTVPVAGVRLGGFAEIAPLILIVPEPVTVIIDPAVLVVVMSKKLAVPLVPIVTILDCVAVVPDIVKLPLAVKAPRPIASVLDLVADGFGMLKVPVTARVAVPFNVTLLFAAAVINAKVPPTVTSAPVIIVSAEPLATVTLLKFSRPEPAAILGVPAPKVTVPVLGVNVPLLVQTPVTVNTIALFSTSILPAFIVTLTQGVAAVIVTVWAIVTLSVALGIVFPTQVPLVLQFPFALLVIFAPNAIPGKAQNNRR